jgi:CelD/BcsL family acetyltransferase involved in cellulose biosynthesis
MVGSLSNYYTALFSPLIAEGATSLDLAPLILRLRQEADPASSLTFQPLDPLTNEYHALTGALELCGYRVFPYRCQGNWLLRTDSDWDSYLAKRPPELRNTIRRHQKKLLAAGGVTEIIQQGPDLEASLIAFEQVYARSWKRAEPLVDFIPTLVRAYAAKGCLRLGVIRLGGAPIASQIWIVVAGRAAIYKLAYDDDFKRFGAGTVLTAELMRHVMEVDQVHEVDFLTGDEPFKSQWMTDREERRGIVAHRPESAKGLLRIGREYASRLLPNRQPDRLPH